MNYETYIPEQFLKLGITTVDSNEFIRIFSDAENNRDNEDWILNELLPRSLVLLNKRYNKRYKKCPSPKCLCVTVGSSLDPLLLSILTIRPTEKLVLIYSKDTAHVKEKILDTLKQNDFNNKISLHKFSNDDPIYIFVKAVSKNNDYIRSILLGNTEPNNVFKIVKRISDEYKTSEGTGEKSTVGVDISGGKKSMIGGSFLAASITDCQIYYVDFEEYHNTYPLPGTEFIHILPNPYDIYNVREESLIQELWVRQDFDAVNKFVGQAISKLIKDKVIDYDLEKERNRLIQIKTAANCYIEWQKFNYSQSQINAQLKQGIYFNYYREKHCNILKSLSQCHHLRNNAYGSILLALDRWKRGSDSLYLEEFDKSALHFTQAIEILCSYRLFDMSITGKLEGVFDFGVNPHNNKQHSPEASGSIKFLFHGKNEHNSVKIYNAGISLKWKNGSRFYEIAPYLTIDNICSYLTIRNDFAHFSCFSKEKIADTHEQMLQFQETTKSFITLFITTYQNETGLEGNSFEELQAPFEFAKFTDFNHSN